jgi:ATP-dependent Clp protease ATP-binding subunit ClpB
MLKIIQDSKPDELANLDRVILTLKIEQESLKKETDSKSVERQEEIQNLLKGLQKDYEKLEKVWLKERDDLKKIKKIKGDLEQAKKDCESAQRNNDLAKASIFLYDTIPKLKSTLESLETYLYLTSPEKDETRSLIHERVTSQDIAQVISRSTGIPITSLVKGEREKLSRIEDELQKSIVGQKPVVEG